MKTFCGVRKAKYREKHIKALFVGELIFKPDWWCFNQFKNLMSVFPLITTSESSCW